AEFSQKQYSFILLRVKTLSNMLLNVSDVSQDGRFSVKISGQEKRTIDIRVSVLPSNYGENIVMRLLGTSATKLNLDELGMEPEMFETIKAQINQPNGMILSTGPTGSGKTTTLYACLNYVNKPGTNIITIEDPIEYQLEGITQTQIENRRKYTFAKALRSIVRQDPDILMVGEIRDEDSAKIAVQFSLTGHLVFSTLHTNDAVGAVPRLVGMEVEPSSLSSSLKIVIAQRLVRRLCPECKKESAPSKEILDSVKKIIASVPKSSGIKIPDKMSFFESKGCPKCHGLGYQGRIGVFEIMAVDKEIEELILNKATSYQLAEKAAANGMITLVQGAIMKATEGITSLEEAERIVGSFKIAAEKIKSPH
ncbi:GspE/PulE family protein, partial [Patescibacteria group bacterium]|nr:GspE/PulE family protein [Patescibacteria group bacterium]